MNELVLAALLGFILGSTITAALLWFSGEKIDEMHVLVQKEDGLNTYVFTDMAMMEAWLKGTNRDKYEYLIAQVDPR